MSELRITGIAKADDSVEHTQITHIGDVEGGWCYTAETAIALIEAQRTVFFVEHWQTRKRTYLGVVHEPHKPACLRAHTRGIWNDELLHLPACPRTSRVLG